MSKKLILVDCDGVLHDNDARLKRQATAVAKAFGNRPVSEIIKAYFAAHQRVHDEFSNQHDDVPFHFQLMGEAFGVNIKSDQAADLARRWQAAYDDYQQNPETYPDAGPFLEALQAAGLRLVLVSGSTQQERQTFLQAMGLEHFFEAIFAANTVGFQKQQPGFYEHVIQQLGVSAADMAIVGDSYNDDMTAKRFGITTILLHRPGVPEKKPNEWVPDYVVNDLNQAAEIILTKL